MKRKGSKDGWGWLLLAVLMCVVAAFVANKVKPAKIARVTVPTEQVKLSDAAQEREAISIKALSAVSVPLEVAEAEPSTGEEDEADTNRLTYLGVYKVTGYDACAECCGKWADGITASGKTATVNHTVAMCKDFPFGTQVYIDGLGWYTVEDRGVGAGVVDVFCNNHGECYALTGQYDVYIADMK